MHPTGLRMLLLVNKLRGAGGLSPPYNRSVAFHTPYVCVLLALTGCGQREEIAKYSALKPEIVDPTLVAKPVSAPAAGSEQQTIGLIVPVGDVGWFFKLTGDATTVETQHEAFLAFANSIKFAGSDPKPKWTLPEGWKEMPGREMRFATIQIAVEGKPLELSVIPLPVVSQGQGGGSNEKYVRDNVNRWRQQLNLQPVSAEELAMTTKSLKIDGHEATLVSLVGSGSGGMGGAPFAPFAGGALPPDHPPIGGDKTTK